MNLIHGLIRTVFGFLCLFILSGEIIRRTQRQIHLIAPLNVNDWTLCTNIFRPDFSDIAISPQVPGDLKKHYTVFFTFPKPFTLGPKVVFMRTF